MSEELTPRACPRCGDVDTSKWFYAWFNRKDLPDYPSEHRSFDCCERELNALRGELEDAKAALGEHAESPVKIAQRISEIRDEGRAHFHTVTNLLRERDELRADNSGLLDALRGLLEEYNDRQGQFGDDCLWQKHEDKETVEKARAAIAGAATGKEGA